MTTKIPFKRKYISICDININDDFMALPKAFVDIPYYRNMSVDSKYMYILLLDRAKLSFKNNWFDEDGNIYFSFKNDDLRRLTNIPSKQRLIKGKKELISKNLLEQIRFGQGKTNRLYILYPLTEVELKEIGIEPQNEHEDF